MTKPNDIQAYRAWKYSLPPNEFSNLNELKIFQAGFNRAIEMIESEGVILAVSEVHSGNKEECGKIQTAIAKELRGMVE